MCALNNACIKIFHCSLEEMWRVASIFQLYVGQGAELSLETEIDDKQRQAAGKYEGRYAGAATRGGGDIGSCLLALHLGFPLSRFHLSAALDGSTRVRVASDVPLTRRFHMFATISLSSLAMAVE